MNPVFKAASEAAELGWLMGGMTVFFLLFFTGWALWAYAPSNREHLESCGRLPLEEES